MPHRGQQRNIAPQRSLCWLIEIIKKDSQKHIVHRRLEEKPQICWSCLQIATRKCLINMGLELKNLQLGHAGQKISALLHGTLLS